MQNIRGWLFVIAGAAILIYGVTLLPQVDWSLSAFLSKNERPRNATPFLLIGIGAGLSYWGWILRAPTDPKVREYLESLDDT